MAIGDSVQVKGSDFSFVEATCIFEAGYARSDSRICALFVARTIKGEYVVVANGFVQEVVSDQISAMMEAFKYISETMGEV